MTSTRYFLWNSIHQSGPIVVYNDKEIYMSKMWKHAIWSSSYSHLNIITWQKCEENTLTTYLKILELSEQYWTFLMITYASQHYLRSLLKIQLSPGQCYIISHWYKTFTVHPFLGRFLWILLHHREKYTYYNILCLVSWINLRTSFYLGCKYTKSAILRSMNLLQLYTLREQLNKEGKNGLKVCINIPCLDHIGIGA